MSDNNLRSQLLAQLMKLAERLPNGLLHRLVEDAQFFYDWNLKKKKARSSARLAQYEAWKVKSEDKYWRGVRRNG